MRYKLGRVVLKISGEILQGKNEVLDLGVIHTLAQQLKEVKEKGFELILILGGGNIVRGRNVIDYISRETADYIGILSTIINALALKDALIKLNIDVSLQSLLDIKRIAEYYMGGEEAIKQIKAGKMLIIAGGTSYSHFTTDTAAALIAAQIKANALLKATKVNGVYDKDPNIYKDARLYKEIKYIDLINKDLKIMDITAISLCMEERIPIIVFNGTKKDAIKKVLTTEEETYTIIN